MPYFPTHRQGPGGSGAGAHHPTNHIRQPPRAGRVAGWAGMRPPTTDDPRRRRRRHAATGVKPPGRCFNPGGIDRLSTTGGPQAAGRPPGLIGLYQVWPTGSFRSLSPPLRSLSPHPIERLSKFTVRVVVGPRRCVVDVFVSFHLKSRRRGSPVQMPAAESKQNKSKYLKGGHKGERPLLMKPLASTALKTSG